MSQAISKQHPSVVLRSHYNAMRALLAIAMIAVVGLTVAVVVVADDDGGSAANVSSQALTTPASPGTTRYDGGPEEGTRGPAAAATPRESATRYDGGPEEGTRGPGH
jgi:hypothetical protein